MKRRLVIACVMTALVLLDDPRSNAAEFRCNACDVKASDVERCQRMDPADYSTALFLNPDGMKTLFERSSCLQQVAVKYRDASLCKEVRERKSLFFDGSAISRASCEQRVQEKVRSDPKVTISDIYRLASVEYFRNGNGRDIDVHVGFSGSYGHQYELTVSMVDGAGANIETLHRKEYSLGASTGELRVLVRQAQVAAAAGEALAMEPPYRFRVTLALVEPSLAEVRQFASLPREQRESSIDHRIDPAKLERNISDQGL